MEPRFRVLGAALVVGLLVASLTPIRAPGPSPMSATLLLYGTIGNHVVTVNAATADATDLGTTPSYSGLEALAYHAARRTLYGIVDGPTDPKLARIDRGSGQATVIGPIDLQSPFLDLHLAEALAYNPANGKLYAAASEFGVPQGQTRSDRLVTVDPATGAASMVARFTGVEEADAMDFVGGTLYVSNTASPNSYLYAVDPATAAATLVGAIGFDHVADIAYDASTDTMYGSPHTKRVLIRISRATGAGTVIGTTHETGEFGGATLTALAAAPSPTDEGCGFEVIQGSHNYSVRPVEVAQGVVAFYDYQSVSAHTPYVEAFASVLFLYIDTRTGAMYLVFHFNIDNAGSPDAETTFDIEFIPQVPAGAQLVLSDDPGELQLDGGGGHGSFHYFLNTDGGVLGPIPPSEVSEMKLGLSHFGVNPMQRQRWIDGDGTRLPLDMSGSIHVRSVCNRAPTASAGGPYSGLEGSPVTFNAGGSSDPDGDPLTYTWDFQNDGVDDATTQSPTIQHTYPDDFFGKARLTVSDGSLTSSATVDVTAANVAPSVVLDSLAPSPEGAATLVLVRVTDPGADAVIVEFDQGDTRGPFVIGQLFHPTDASVTTSATWGDDGLYSVRVTATDDDGGRGETGAITQIDNAVPGITAVTNPSATEYAEGDEADVELRGRDNGSDDLRIEVDFGNQDVQSLAFFNDGAGPDPDPSPLGTYPFEVFATFTTRYVDDGAFTIRVTATDDDGGVASLEFPVLVRNVAPTILPFGPGTSVEGSPGSLTATATDPGADALTFLWEFELGATSTEAFPASGSPMTATGTAVFLYGDDGAYRVTLTVSDDDGGSSVFETTVAVANASPTAQIAQIERGAAFVLRVAGEKWHDVRASFFAGDTELAFLAVTRTPGSPDEQAAESPSMDLPLEARYSARVLYTPEDDPVNGQPNGANPVWVILRADDGTEVRIHHTFNVEHPGTYAWDVDLTPYVAQLAIRFSGSAADPGSDDLAFAWDFGDLSGVETSIAYNNGAAPDPPKSPGGAFPFTATNSVGHAFAAAGTYVITLTVTDDDGGVATARIVITILG